MKPIPQISPNSRYSCRDRRQPRDHRNFPSTDYSYQATAKTDDSSLPIAGNAHRISKLRTFRKLSSEFFGAETRRDYVTELTLFAVIAGVSAWPIISMIAALYRMLK